MTRRLRELWAVGPLKKPGDGGEAEALNEIRQNAAAVFQLFDRMREEKRQRMARQCDGGLVYITGTVEAMAPQSKSS